MSPIAQRYGLADACDLVQLRYVQAIASCGSMTAAAELLRVSQPTLSNAVRQLEHRLDTALFLRGSRGVAPTASGKALAHAAEAVFALLRQADDQLHGIESAEVGQFAIGCYHSFGAIVLPPLMTELASRAPGIEISLWEGIGPRVVDAVIDRTVHFGIGVRSGAPARPHAELVVVPLFRDLVGVVRARRRPPPGAPLFHVPRIPASQRVIDALRARAALPERLVPCGDLELVKCMVLSGAGLGVLPWRVATQHTPRGALRLVDPALPFEVDVGCLFYRADLHRTRAALTLRDALVSRGRALDATPLPCGIAPIGRQPRTRARPPAAPS